MTLQASGPISFTDIQTEFGGSNPIRLNGFYGRDVNIPSSGQVSVNQFYGMGKKLTAGTGTTYLNNNIPQGAGGVGESFYRLAYTWFSDRSGTCSFYTYLTINATKEIWYQIIIDGTTVVDFTEGQQQSAALPLAQSWTDAGPFSINHGSNVSLSVYLWGGYGGDTIQSGSVFNVLGTLS